MADQRIFTTLLVGILWGCVLGLQRPAPRYSQQLMPDTSFTCHHKIIGSYYADPETDCQLFHVCVSVAGTVQDYRFLCPNDTAFDQESQTCADWYDVDCEAATLYYASDNFDLYRLGSGLESRRYDGTQNDLEPLDHLQRSESSDPVRSSVNNLNRVAPSTNTNNNNNRDILRGSSSSNFFNNRNNGKEDDYDNEKVYREPEQSQAEPRRKSGVRKVARKQQFNSNSNVITPTTATPSTTFDNQNRNNNQNSGSSYNQRNNNQNNGNYNQQRNYNYNNFNQRQTQTNNYPTSSSARPYVEQTNNYPTSSSARPYFEQTNNYPTSSSARPYVEQTNNYPRNNQNRNYNTPSSTFRPATTNAFQGSNYNNNNNNQQTAGGFGNFDSSKFGATNQQTTNYGSTAFDRTPAVTTTVRSTDFTANVATKIKKPTDQSGPTFTNQFNLFSTQPTTLRPSTSFQTSDYTGYYQKNYNTIQRTANTGGTTFQTSTFASTSYDDYSVTPRTSEPQTANKVQTTRQQDFTQTTQRFANSFAGSSYIPTTYSPVTKKQATIGNANTQSQVINRGNDQYTGQYESARTTNSGQYRERNTQQTEQTYDTSRSNDNSGQYNREAATKAPKKVATQYNNYESKTNFDGSTKSFDNFDQGGRTASVNGFSPASVNKLAESPVTVRATTPVPRRTVYNNPTTQRPSSAAATNYASQTTPNSRTGNFVSATPRPFTSTTRTVDRRQESTTAKSKSEKKNDYDYAYYDNAGALEYDGIDLEQGGGSRDTAKVTRN